MKARFFLLFVTIFTVSQVAKAEWGDKAYSDRRLSEEIRPIKHDINSLTEGTSSNTKAIKALNERIQKLESDVNRLQKRVDSLEKGATNLESIGRKGDKTDIKANVALWITIPIVMVICSILCFAFWPRKSKSVAISSARSDQHKCPRCGWEHDPDDTVCRNPNCRTQF